MRKTKLTAEEIVAAEKASDVRKSSRKNGFDLMKVRDGGHGRLKDYNGKAKEINILWGYDGKFKLDIRPYGQAPLEIVLDTEEVRKWLRWA